MNTVIEKAKKVLGLKKQEKHDPGFYLLPDRPITPDKKEDVRFGHQHLASAVFELLKNAEPPFTVGLYGKWGVGKTTIALLVKEFACNNDFKCLFFDAWKYERDSLRRQFLIELDRQVFNKRLGYKEKLNQTLSKPEKITIGDYIKRVFSSVVPRTIGILTILLVLAFIASTFFNKGRDVSTILSLAFQLGLVGTLVSFILSSFEVIKGSTQFHRTDSAEGFEDHFIEAISESELRDKKLLVVVDNLDRVEDSKAVSILSDIKTFLSRDGNEHKILFLIPCDDQALRAQLSAIYGDGFDTDEFLRKFFNLTIKIPKFIDLDLFNYVRDLLVASKVSEFQNNSDLEGVIIYALRDNPREIKQFINSLIPQILLARKRKLGPVLKNPAFLAKLLVIRQKFPILYEIIEERSLRSQISLDASEIVDLYKAELKLKQWYDEKISRETKKFELFNGYTPGINEKNIDIFLTLRQSEEERKIPEWKSLVLALEEGQKEDAQKIFSQIMADEKIKVLDSLLKSYLEKLKSGPSLIKLLSTILPIAQKEKQELKYFFDAAANYFPFGQDFAKVYQQFDSSMVFSFWYLNTPESKRQKISSPFVGLFAISQNDGMPAIDYEYALSLLDLLNQNPKIFYSFKLSLKQYLESTYFKHPYLARIDSEEARKCFITENAGAKYVDSLIKDDFKDTDDLKSALGFWQNLKLPDGAVINSIKKYRELFDSFSTATDEEKLALCAGLFAFLKKYSDILTNEDMEQTLITEISTLSTILGSYYDQLSNARLEIINLIDFFAVIDKNTNKNILGNKIESFIQESSNESLLKINKQKIKDWATRYPGAILGRSQKDETVLLEKEIFKLLTPEQNQTIVVGLLSNKQNPENLLSAIEYKVQNTETTIDQIISTIPDLSSDIFPDIFKSLRGLGIDKDSTRIENLKNKLVEYKNQHSDQAEIVEKIAKRNRGLFNPGQRKDLFGEDEIEKA